MKAKPKKANRRVVGVTKGSGNVFADPGLPNSERKLIRAQLTLQIYSILKDSGMTPVEIERALIEKWNGQLPVVESAGGGLLLLLPKQ